MNHPLMDSKPETPYLLLNRSKSEHNINRLKRHLNDLDVPLRPHVKTAKSLEVAQMLFPDGPGPITVSTLAEAEFFAAAGYKDILYAVGIAPNKLNRVAQLRSEGVDLVVLLDSAEQAEALAQFCTSNRASIPTLIEIDCDGHRGGIAPDSPELLHVATLITNGSAEVRGVLTHAGESYSCFTDADRTEAAENERQTAVKAAERLRAAGHAAPVVSIGSTPTAHATKDLTGVTEVRAGNFVFFDLVMAGNGVCDVTDLALSVVTTVIGHREDKGWIMTDAGWMATSSDKGTSSQPVNQYFGLVATRDGALIPDLVMIDATQEHGALAMRPGTDRPLPEIPVGTEVRILPIHACATASQHDVYRVISKDDGPIEAIWNRTHGW
ncbi:alanine racemase [Paenarthrobacter sp. NCHU4564]|uniref:alanine racemase n=1 Tax=Paenarthrobacter sp. NCHU4564 TaxID=3451353 RepID=UPI003F9BE65F